jgi:hypothetical protein
MGPFQGDIVHSMVKEYGLQLFFFVLPSSQYWLVHQRIPIVLHILGM